MPQLLAARMAMEQVNFVYYHRSHRMQKFRVP